jgi:hypothetical protein
MDAIQKSSNFAGYSKEEQPRAQKRLSISVAMIVQISTRHNNGEEIDLDIGGALGLERKQP